MVDDEILAKLKGTEAIVRDLLKKDVRCRNSDMHLILAVWRRQMEYGDDTPICLTEKIISMFDLANPETIIRARAKIQNRFHLYLPTEPEIRKRRHIKEEVFKKWAVENE